MPGVGSANSTRSALHRGHRPPSWTGRSPSRPLNTARSGQSSCCCAENVADRRDTLRADKPESLPQPAGKARCERRQHHGTLSARALGENRPLTWGPFWDHTLCAVMNDPGEVGLEMRRCAIQTSTAVSLSASRTTFGGISSVPHVSDSQVSRGFELPYCYRGRRTRRGPQNPRRPTLRSSAPDRCRARNHHLWALQLCGGPIHQNVSRPGALASPQRRRRSW
jgi:hypothetical protein